MLDFSLNFEISSLHYVNLCDIMAKGKPGLSQFPGFQRSR